MNRDLIPTDLRPIYEKVANSERITDADALTLYAARDLNALGAIANLIRERKNGNAATYILNRYINYSNVCILSCQFCAFAAKKRDAHAFEFAISEILATVRDALKDGITEIHMVGGLHPSLKPEWYLELLREMQALDPKLHIKSFTAVEVWHLANRGSSCTMLFGHVENHAHRVKHLRQLRELQDETHGFTGFVPYAFTPDEGTQLSHIKRATAFEELRNLAVSRIYLDNFEHITGYWISMGLPLAQLSLNYGVDDLHGTIMEEKIFHMAGEKTPQEQTVATMERTIREAGRDPHQRDSYYNHIASTAANRERNHAAANHELVGA